VLAPWLASRGVSFSARLVGKPGHKGGVGDYQRAQRDIVALLRQESTTVVTTMFDFYGMPGSWPGRKRARRASHAKKAPTVEQAILEDVAKQMGPKFNRKRFLASCSEKRDASTGQAPWHPIRKIESFGELEKLFGERCYSPARARLRRSMRFEGDSSPTENRRR